MDLKKPKTITVVCWEDPSSLFDGWVDPDAASLAKVPLILSVGLAFKEDENYLYLAMDWDAGHINTVGKIPKSVIKDRKDVRFPRGFPRKDSVGGPKKVQDVSGTPPPEPIPQENKE